jgi:hypothetical protein
MAKAILPPNLDAAKDREKWRKVTPPERKKRSPEHSQVLEETRTPSRPVQEELPQSSDVMSPPPNKNGKEAIEEEEGEDQGTVGLWQQTPSRRGLWDWARVGTGRLNIIGRIPHPEWRGPMTARNVEPTTNGASTGEIIRTAHDDFSIPSTTATPDNAEQQREAATAKLEGLGIVQSTIMSPSFAQTKQSSDDLIAAASSTGSPAWQQHADGHWTSGVTSTPSAASKDSQPSTPDTPTPQQRKREVSIGEPNVPNGHNSPTPHGKAKQLAKEEVAASKESLAVQPVANTPSKPDGISADTPKSNISAKTTKSSKTTASPHPVPTYKIALAPNLISPASNGTASH